MSTSYVLFKEQAEPGLYLVYPANSNEPCTCEIFILHGLNGGPTKTWQHPETNCIWFRDLLPEHLKAHARRNNARIWTYGYNASSSFNTQNIYGHALTLLNRVKAITRGNEGRKILWICHSLGGILVKSALIEASLQSRYKPIHTATTGIIFLGTPHRGSGVATLGQVAALVAGAAVPGWQVLNRGLLKSLEKDNEGLFQTSNRFVNICTEMRIHSFYETTPLGPRVIVEQHSAVLSISNEDVAHGLDANHKELCRFRGSYDQNWLPVLTSILDLVTAPRYTQPGYRANGQMDGSSAASSSSYYPFQERVPRVPVGGRQQPPPPPQRPYRPTVQNTPPGTIPPYPNSMYNTNRGPPVPRPIEVDATAASGNNMQANPQYMPYRPRPPQTTQSEGATYLQPPVFSGASQNSHQRNVSHDSADSSGRRPYPSINPAHSREDLSVNMQEYARTSSAPPIPSKQQREQPFSPPPEHPASDIGQAKTSDSILDPVSAEVPDDEAMQEAALCDGCMNSIYCSQPRVTCTECYDYDLCISCFQLGRVSKNHKNTHKVSHILSTQRIFQDDLTPPLDIVNPEYNADKSKVNWSIVETQTESTTVGGEKGTQCWRMLHMYGNDSHARFLTSAKPGHFSILIHLELAISSLLSDADRQTLQEEGLGWLRISLGTLRNKKDFFTGRYREDAFETRAFEEDSLAQKLMKVYWYEVVRLPVGQQTIQINSDEILSVEGRQGSIADLGLILQWSGVRSFESNNEPLVKLAVLSVKLDDLLDYNEPLIRVPAPDAPQQAPQSAPIPTPTPTPAAPAASTTGNEEELSVEDWIAALAQIRQEVQDAQQRAVLEEALRLRAEQEEKQKRDAIFQALFVRQALNEYARSLGGGGGGFNF